MTSIALWIMAIIFVEAVTEIVINGDIFEKLREFLHYFSKFTSSLIGCGYCLSVWVSACIAWALPVGFDNITLDFLVATFVLHRLSNVFHELMSRWFGRIPWTLQLDKTERVVIED